MTTPLFDEMQQSIRSSAGSRAAIIMGVLAYLDAMVSEIWGPWADPLVHAHAVVLPALVYFCWRTSRYGAYLARGAIARNAALITGFLCATQGFSAITFAFRGRWLDDGRAGLFVANVMLGATMLLITVFILRSAAHDHADE